MAIFRDRVTTLTRFLSLSALFVAGGIFAPPALAAQGDACTVANKIYTVEGPGQPSLICDGSVLQILQSASTGPIRKGVGVATPQATLHINGETMIGNTGLTCAGTTEGSIRYNSTDKNIEVCDGTSWGAIVASACDNAPAYLSFSSLSAQATSTLVTSDIVAVTGMDAGCSVTVGVSGTGGSPEYRICTASDCSTVEQAWTAANNASAFTREMGATSCHDERELRNTLYHYS